MIAAEARIIYYNLQIGVVDVINDIVFFACPGNAVFIFLAVGSLAFLVWGT